MLYPILNAREFHDGEKDRSQVGIRALNDTTLEFTLAERTAHFEQILASPVILPVRQDLIDQYGDAWTSPQHYLGNGMYTLAEADASHILVEKNLNYNGPIQPAFSQIAFDIIAEPDQQVAAYKNGDVDVLLSTPLETIMNDVVLRGALTVLPSPGVQYLGFMTQVGPTGDVLVRKALASAIDRQVILDDVLQTSWRVEATGVIPPELAGYQGSAVGFPYNPSQAQAYLAQAGYPGGAGFPALTFLVSESQHAIMQEIASQWETVLGITVDIHVGSVQARNQVLAECRNTPAACAYNGFALGWLVDYPDAYNIVNDLFGPASQYNYTQWDNIQYRALIDLTASEMDPAQRISYLQQAEQSLVQDDAVIAPLFHTDYAMVVRPGIFPYYSGSFFSNLAYWSDVDPAGDGVTAEVIGSTGGTISTENQTVTVTVPDSALQEDVTLSVTDLGGNYQITASQDQLDVLESFTIQPHGLQFDTPATLLFAWNDADDNGMVDGTDKSESNLFLLKDGEPITDACAVNPSCDMTANQLSVQVSSLSLFELVAPLNTAPVANAGPDQTVYLRDMVLLDASASFDPDGDALTYDWDLDNDGQYDDASGVTAAATFLEPGISHIGLRVTDDGGSTSKDTVTITILPWDLRGFYRPVDMNGVYNLVKGGSTVPLKFEIFAGLHELSDVSLIRNLTYAQISCDANAIIDEIEITATGSTMLHYDAVSGQFIYNWKTPNMPGKCFRITVTSVDGSSLMAYFKLK